MARKRRDPLRTKLDRLAEQIADEALGSEEAEPVPLRDKVTALKVAGAYWGISRKGEKLDAEPDAWTGYQRRMVGNGKDHDAAQDDA